jgi:hypothetical protein
MELSRYLQTSTLGGASIGQDFSTVPRICAVNSTVRAARADYGNDFVAIKPQRFDG